MKITKVTYQKTYRIGPYLIDRVGFEAEPNNETPEVILSNLEKMADEWHKKDHPHLYQENVQEGAEFKTTWWHEIPGVTAKSEAPKDRIAALIADIYTVTDLKVLESYKLMVKKDPQLQAAYDLMYSILNVNE